MTPKEQDSSLTKPVPTEDGQEIFADNLGAAGAEVIVSSNDPFIGWLNFIEQRFIV